MIQNKFEKEINYAGKKCRLIFVYDEKETPNWSDFAQDTINQERKMGNVACCIHKEFEHGLYIGIVQKAKQ